MFMGSNEILLYLLGGYETVGRGLCSAQGPYQASSSW